MTQRLDTFAGGPAGRPLTAHRFDAVPRPGLMRAMISLVIPTLNAEQTLGGCLGGLMRAAIDGLVREVVVVDGGSTDATLEVADDAGAEIVTARGDVGALLAAGCGAVQSSWLMTLRPHMQLLPGWEAMVKQHLETRAGQGAWLPSPGAGFLSRLVGPRDGAALLLPRRAYEASPGFKAGVAEGRLARRLSRLRRIDAPALALA